nr:unnamed protein product [Callosobruchus analis]
MTHCEKFDFKTILVAQTYDGAAVMASELNVAPPALFTHCYAHALNLVLSKACNINKHARIFFSNLTGFSAFFSKSTKRTNILNEICSAKLPSNAATRWNFTSRAVFTVLASFNNDNHTIKEAVGLRNHMQDCWPLICIF